MLQEPDNDCSNSLHHTYKQANLSIFEAIIEVSNKLTTCDKPLKEEESQIMKNYMKFKYNTILRTENKNNNNVLMTLMQAKNNMGCTPFFYLWDIRKLRKYLITMKSFPI